MHEKMYFNVEKNIKSLITDIYFMIFVGATSKMLLNKSSDFGRKSESDRTFFEVNVLQV